MGCVVVLFHPVPDVVLPAPQAEGTGIGGAVVHRDAVLLHIALRLGPRVPGGVEEVVNQTSCSGPFPQNEPPVEGAAVTGTVTLPDPGGEGGVVIHGEVEV